MDCLGLKYGLDSLRWWWNGGESEWVKNCGDKIKRPWQLLGKVNKVEGGA